IHLQGFELDTVLARYVLDGDGAEVGESGLGADGGVLGEFGGDDVVGKLIGPGFESGEFGFDAGGGVFGGVVGHGGECPQLLIIYGGVGWGKTGVPITSGEVGLRSSQNPSTARAHTFAQKRTRRKGVGSLRSG